jgi:hypothetical protein
LDGLGDEPVQRKAHQRAHGVGAAEDHAGVDVLRADVAGLGIRIAESR